MSQKKEAAREVTETGTELKEKKYVREKTRWRVIRIILYIVIGLCLLAGRSAQWVTEEWGDLTLDEVIFTMTQPLKGTDSGIIRSYILYAVVPALVIVIVLILIDRIFLAGWKEDHRTGRTDR